MTSGLSREAALVIIFAIAILGPTAILTASGFASIHALGRNPSAAPKIFTAMVILLLFGTAISIIALLVLFQLFMP
jgi:F0F1-type ATP synthase membrane subunit c/vacuolar-type H+-ATPase subunit K